MNLVVTAPSFYTVWLDRPFPSNPASAHFPIQERIGRLMPRGKDTWWEVRQDTNIPLPLLAEEVLSALREYALPFFAVYADEDRLLIQLRSGSAPGCTPGQVPIIHALVAAELGHEREATEVLRSAIDDAVVSSFAERARAVGKRLGLL